MIESITRTIALEIITAFQNYGISSKQISIAILVSKSDFQKLTKNHAQLNTGLLEDDSRHRKFVPTEISFATGFDLNTAWTISFRSQLVRRTYGLSSMLLRNSHQIDETLNVSSKLLLFSPSSFEEISENVIDKLGKQGLKIRDLDIHITEIVKYPKCEDVCLRQLEQQKQRVAS
ncbi:MAG: hypothetical protein R3E39_10690 [Anaerolineae bacterium]